MDKSRYQKFFYPVLTYIQYMGKLLRICIYVVPFCVCLSCRNYSIKVSDSTNGNPQPNHSMKNDSVKYWVAADINSITDSLQKQQVVYGRELIAHTSKYLGPKGSLMKTTNGMNCQNCHLLAGTAVFGNNFGSVASLYPKYRARRGTFETEYERINDCLERSLNGEPLDSNTKEMQAIVAYFHFIGSNVPKGTKALGSGLKDLPYLDRAADANKGKMVYVKVCQSCHQIDGQGKLNEAGNEYTYPPLWGPHSFNDAAGMFRLGTIARYVKYNMPFGTSFRNPQLTDEQAWDVAAYIVSQPRSHINEPKDWPDLSAKPVDFPFAPYADHFPEQQHKYGPFKPILAFQKTRDNKKG
ncbi:MAG: c-type cytochrome [Bacteroidetes bacterium]|nr:c-type cytochrome [Bacteroidota bacterium]